MPRSTKKELEREIIDHAAALFARHGYSHTSLQQIASSVGYSKAGVLHHYSSKEAIYEATIEVTRAEISTLVDRAVEVGVGHSRDRLLIESLADLTQQWPGIAALGNALLAGEPTRVSQLALVGTRLMDAFSRVPTHSDVTHGIRILMAVAGITVAALEAVRQSQYNEWRQDIVAAALGTLGHADTSVNSLHGQSAATLRPL